MTEIRKLYKIKKDSEKRREKRPKKRRGFLVV